MKLYVNGCSFCWGANLKDRENEAFSFLLQKELGCTLINDSKGGSSNQEILRRTLNTDLDDCFVIIGWTGIFRYEYCENITDLAKKTIHYKWQGVLPSGTKNYNWPIEPIDWYVVNFMNQVLALQNYLKYKNIPFFFFLSFEQIQEIMWDSQDPKTHKKNISYNFNRYYKHIDKKTFPSLFNKDLIWTNYVDYTEGNGFNRSGGHPDKDNHREWADYLKESCNLEDYL